MKPGLRICAVAISLMLALPIGAYAGEKELAYRAQTLLRDSDGAHLSLCALVETRSAIIVNFWRRVHTYALAPNNCDHDQYYTFSGNDLTQALESGKIVDEVPTTPKLTTMETFGGFWGWGLIPVVGVMVGSRLLRKPQKKRRRSKEVDLFSRRAAAVMTLTASLQGAVMPPQIVRIRQMLHHLTGTDIPEHAIRDILNSIEIPQHDDDFRRFGAGLASGERDDLVKAALMVVAEEDTISEDVPRFLAGLHMELGVTGARFNEMVNILFSQRPNTSRA